MAQGQRPRLFRRKASPRRQHARVREKWSRAIGLGEHSGAGASAPLPKISQWSRSIPSRHLSRAYSPAPFCRRVTDLTCGDLRSLALSPTLPLPTSSSLRDNSYPTGPSLFTTEGGSVAGKSVCSGGLSPTGFLLCLFPPKCVRLNPSADTCMACAPSTLALERALWKDNRLPTLSRQHYHSTL
jgi:hypothetical protein